MASWQRRARLGLGVFVVVFATVVYLSIRDRRSDSSPPAMAPLAPRVIAETRGGDVVQLKGAERDVRVEFAGQVTYEDGQNRLQGIKAVIDNRAGRTFTITAAEGQIGPTLSNIDLVGDVTVSTTDGLEARAGEAHYADAEGIVRAPGPVTFASGRMAGSGSGFTYDRQRDTLWLLADAAIRLRAEDGTGGLEVTADRAGFARLDRYLRFEGGARLVRDGQVVNADTATVHLQPDRDQPTRIELNGDASVAGTAGVGSLRAMQARDITLAYADDGQTLQQATLAGAAAIDLAAPDGSSGQQLSGDWIDVLLAPDGAVTSLASRDAVRVTLPGAHGQSARTIRATALAASGEAGRGLTTMRFDGRVEFREATGRVARADRLDVGLGGTGGTLGRARFTGAFRFEDGALRATSADAVYDVTAGTLALEGRRGAMPHVEAERSRIDAEAIDVTLSPRRLVATGTVRSVIQPAARAAGDAPTLLAEGQAINVTADALTFDEAGGRGVYKGQARLWQGDTAVQADTIDLHDAAGDLSASGNVRTALALGSAATQTDPAPKPTLGRAATFQYTHATRQAVYDTAAQLNGAEGDLSGNRIQIVLAGDSNAIDRIEATGTVRIAVEGREARGARLVYVPANRQYQLTGSPVSLIEDCRETTGQTLTFYRASDRILIDGNEEARTQTKGGGECPEPRFE